MKTNKLLVAAVLAIAIGAPIAGFVGYMNGAQPMTSTVRVPFLHGLPGAGSPMQPDLSSFQRATEWLNSLPLTAAGLRGKVVLVDFWTYTCINWLRTLPYVGSWAEKTAWSPCAWTPPLHWSAIRPGTFSRTSNR
jgi:hypothetical protein